MSRLLVRGVGSGRGRVQADNPLFRNPTAVEATSVADFTSQIPSRAPADTDEHDPRAVARGVAVGVSAGALLWAVIWLVGRALF
jgi:hypothetical protein